MFTLAYFNPAVQVGVQGWPDRLRARYFALTMRMAEHGPDLGMPHTRALGSGLFEIRAKSSEGIARARMKEIKA